MLSKLSHISFTWPCFRNPSETIQGSSGPFSSHLTLRPFRVVLAPYEPFGGRQTERRKDQICSSSDFLIDWCVFFPFFSSSPFLLLPSYFVTDANPGRGGRGSVYAHVYKNIAQPQLSIKIRTSEAWYVYGLENSFSLLHTSFVTSLFAAFHLHFCFVGWNTIVFSFSSLSILEDTF